MAGKIDDRRLMIPPDDAVVVFRTVKSAVSGRLVRLGATADAILKAHKLADLAAETLGHALTLSALIGSALPVSGRLILQARTNGPVSLLVADFDAPGRLRGYARYDTGGLSAAARSRAKLTAADALGDGHLAITIDPGPGSDRYQGIVALDGATLAAAAADYFENRESLPTFVRLAAAKYSSAGSGGAWRWRTGGLMMQKLSRRDDQDAAPEIEEDSDHWNRVRTLAATLEDHELLDPALSAEHLLLRLFHEEGVRVERALPLSHACKCSRQRVADVLASFGAKEISDMRDDAGRIVVTCEFCATAYAFEPAEIAAP
ncbi:MAG: Hsp33 family molecular chaperone HslO [Hyphomicrobium sp.]